MKLVAIETANNHKLEQIKDRLKAFNVHSEVEGKHVFVPFDDLPEEGVNKKLDAYIATLKLTLVDKGILLS